MGKHMTIAGQVERGRQFHCETDPFRVGGLLRVFAREVKTKHHFPLRTVTQEDLIQEAFVEVCKSRHRYDSAKGAQWSTWVVTIARRRWNRIIKLAQRDAMCGCVELNAAAYTSTYQHNTVGGEIADAYVELEEAMNRREPNNVDVLRTVIAREGNYAEAGRELGMESKRVRKVMARVRRYAAARALRNMLDQGEES